VVGEEVVRFLQLMFEVVVAAALVLLFQFLITYVGAGAGVAAGVLLLQFQMP
jgi:hypothetical protein